MQRFIYNLSLWVLGLAVSNINESQLKTYESKALFLMTGLQYCCVPGLAGTRWNKNLCAGDAGCAGGGVTVDAHHRRLSMEDLFALTVASDLTSNPYQIVFWRF